MTRKARFYRWALDCVNEVDPPKRKDYAQKVRSACSLLASSGLYQTVAFVGAKQEFTALNNHLSQLPAYDTNLLDSLRNASVARHIRIRYDVEEALVFLKRAAEAATAGEDEEHASEEETGALL